MRTSTVSVGLLLTVCGSARAQVGTGWVSYDPPSAIHLDGSAGIETYPGNSTMLMNEGASFTNQNGIETFALHNPISNRSERRIQNTYLEGRRQFEGEVRVSPPTNDESVMQIFGGNSGATTQMIRAYADGGGTLRKVPGSVVLAENIHGVWIKVNVIHDIAANVVLTYINGRLLATGDGEATNAGTDGWYHKYGCYGTLRTGSAKVEWRNVKHFRDGTAPPIPDGGVATARRDGGSSADAASLGTDSAREDGAVGGRDSDGEGGDAAESGGTAGNGGDSGGGGSSGTGGNSAGGSAGSAGRGGGGSGGDDDEPDDEPPITPRSPETGCSCRTDGHSGRPTFALVTLLGLLLAFRRRA